MRSAANWRRCKSPVLRLSGLQSSHSDAALYNQCFMPFNDLQAFLKQLESTGDLKRIRVEVDPILEAPEISQRVVREGGPALLFERPKGSPTPLVMNLFGAMKRIRIALGREPDEIGHELL